MGWRYCMIIRLLSCKALTTASVSFSGMEYCLWLPVSLNDFYMMTRTAPQLLSLYDTRYSLPPSGNEKGIAPMPVSGASVAR